MLTCNAKFANNNNKCWLINHRGNYVYEADFNKNKISFLHLINCEDMPNSHLTYDMVYAENKVFILPNDKNEVLVVDLNSNLIHNLYIKDSKAIRFTSKVKYQYAMHINGYVYIIPYNYPYIIRIDADTEEMEYINIYHGILEYYINGTWPGAFQYPFHSENKIYMPFRFDNKLLVLDTLTLETEIKTVGETKTDYISLCKDDGAFWLISENGDITKCDSDSGQIEFQVNYEDFGYKRNTNDNLYLWPFVFNTDEEMWIFANIYPVIKIKKPTGEISKADELGIYTDSRYSFVLQNEDMFYAHIRDKNCLLAYDWRSSKIKEMKLALGNEDGPKMLKAFIDYVVAM